MMQRASLATAVLACGLYLLLGSTVSHSPLSWFDTMFISWQGKKLSFAWFCTQSAFLPELTAIGISTLLYGFFNRRWLLRSIMSVTLIVLAWLISNAGKAFFHRPRPLHWYMHHETSYSYASGHATNAVIVYGLWAFFFWQSTLTLTLRVVITGILGLWVFAVSWSRLALGAHYATDIIGGWLLGIALIGMLFSLVPAIIAVPRTQTLTKS